MSPTVDVTVRRLLPALAFIALPSLTVGLLTPAFAHGLERDRGKRGQQSERTIAAAPNVMLSACTLSGDFTVRSWNRNEVHVRINGGAEIELTRIDQSTSEPATELRLTTRSRRSTNICLMFGDVEMDVPRGASVRLTTTSGDISVVDLARVNVTTTSGSIGLTKIREETSATVIGGDISVRDATGSFRLHSTGGSIDARDLAPAVAGDSFTANTVSGEVLLTRVQHQHLSVNSVSGEVVYTGGLLRNASYNFQSLSGEVHLSLPANASFRLTANVGESVKISSDFNLNNADNQDVLRHRNRRAPRTISVTVGAGEAGIHVSLMTGWLRIQKQ